MNNSSPLTELFVKYLQDRCTAWEAQQLSAYFENEENEAVLRQLIRAELERTHRGEISDNREDTVLTRVRSALLQKIAPDHQRLYAIPRWLKICAVWLLLAGAAALLVTRAYHRVQLLTAITRPGERRSLTLADGTKIWLSPSSTLGYPDQFTGNLREVRLEGEAFFEVAKDKKHPFVIHSDRMATRVVGTSFTVRAYPAQKTATVTVVTGIVKVAAGKERQVTLQPNQRSLFDLKSGALTVAAYPDAAQMLKRKDGILAYDGAPVQEVAADLSSYYQRPVILENRSKNCLCYGEFDTKRPENIVLQQLAAAINAKIIVQKDKYLLKGGCEE